tara:strand:+ start:211 stop:381 length:171 start_codon:yes stop_codon:yes gene_type:complete
MNRKYDVKDQVALKSDPAQRGIIVERVAGGLKVLWDRDWRTGRAHFHKRAELVHLK